MEKREMKKILSCFVVIAILMSAMPVSVFAVNNSINSTSNTSNRSNEILLEKANSNFTPIFHTGINQTIDSKEIDSTNNIATVQGEVIPYKEKGEVLFRGEVYSNWYDSWGGVDWELKTVSIKKVFYDPNNYLQGKNSICVLKPEFSYPRMDWGSSDSLVEVYGQYVVGEKDGEIRYTEVRLCEPGEEWGSREYFVRDLTVGDTYKFTGTITYVSRNPSRAGIYSIDLDDSSYGWDWYGEVYFSNTPNGPRIDNMAVGDKAEIRGSRHYYNDGRAEIDLITSDHYLKKKDSEPAQFYIRPACQDVNGNPLDDVSYEFVDYPTYKGTCDYSEYLLAPGHGTYNVKFTKGNLEAAVTLESHLKPFAGTVVTLREKEGSIYATSTPYGANVHLDGTYKGTSPITIPNVPVGTHTVKYTKTGYEECMKTVTVYANQQRNVHCGLVPVQQTGSIYATSTPSDANVYLDGTYKGVSPITISNVLVGSHTVKYTKAGYKDCEKTVTVYANQQRSVHCDLDFTPEHITIGELVEKLEKGPESVVDKKFVTSGWVLVSTHEGYKGIEILWKILRIVSQIGSGGIVDIGKVPPQWLAPNFMVIWPNSIQDQNFCDSHKAFPYIEAYAANEDLWANSWDVVNMKGVVKKKNILWYTFYQFEVEEMDINPEYSDLEELLKSNEGDHVKFMCVVNKSLKVEIISPLGLCGSLHIQPKQTIDIPYQALVKVEGTIKDIKTIEEEGKERYEYYLEAESVEKILTVKEPSVKTAQTQTIAIQCPVNTTITDQYGRIIADDGTNEIPDASMIVTKEMKIFYLPADLRYSVDIDAYDTGTFNFTRFSPIGNDISITKFENIPVTSSTKASVEIEPGVTDYTMSIDYDGDGVTDEERAPDERNGEGIPDLTISDYSWTPENPKVGDNVKFTVTVTNIGNGYLLPTSALAFGIEKYQNECPTNEWPINEVFDIPILKTGESKTFTEHYTFKKPGTYLFFARAITDSEKNEFDQVKEYFEVSGVSNKPDLIIEAVYWRPINPTVKDSVQFRAVVRNQGEACANSSTVKMNIVGKGVTNSIYFSVPAIPPSVAKPVKSDPQKLKSCDYRITAIADAYEEIDESDESNNERTRTFHVARKKSKKLPDLQIPSVKVEPNPFYDANHITLTFVIANRGDVDTLFNYGIYFNGQHSVTTSMYWESLKAGESREFSEGYYYPVEGTFKVCADYNNDIKESDERNNCASVVSKSKLGHQ